MPGTCFVRLLLLLPVFALAPSVRAQDLGVEFFEKKIRPVFVEHCYECHATTAKKVRGGLLLDTRDGVRKGGESGPAVVPGEPDKSLLIRAVRFMEDGLKMPPKGKLPAAVIADLEAWVKMGAPDPRDKVAVKVAGSWEDIVRLRRTWWSLQPVRNVPPPKRMDSQDGIDGFIHAKLEVKRLVPGKPADPRTLIRRLSLVLTGLPPTSEDIEGFLKDCGGRETASQIAVQKLVDRLLASPHFGERWARHWMDVVRFTETHGNEWNYEVHHAWRYRDYLIRAFNDDVPYDQFVREHIAGDLLPPRWNHKEKINESVIGTAFYRFGEVNHDDCIALRSLGYDLVDNQIDTLTKAFQAMTVSCARCHDHKIDAVSMRDYHGLLGVLRSSRCVSHTIDAAEVNSEVLTAMRSSKEAIRKELAQSWLAELTQEKIAKLGGLNDEKSPLENPLTLWRMLRAVQQKDKLAFADAWKKTCDQLMLEDEQRGKFNQGFSTLADFRQGAFPDWQVGGQGLRQPPSGSGDFVVAVEGARAVSAILPPGCYTHTLSDKLNGTLRSTVLEPKRKHISFQVMGQRSSAVRLVSNNCQLNYRNYRALLSDRLQWITFPVPEDCASLRVYGELMTMFDNPKFPDQLGQLGGDKMDYRVPWEKAAANPRSFFGITHAVLHDQPAPPKPDLAHLRCLFNAASPKNENELAGLYARRLEFALRNWGNDKASSDDVQWLDAFLQAGLLANRMKQNERLEAMIVNYRKLDAQLALPRIIPGMADFGTGFEHPMFTRGDCFRPSDSVPRRFVEILSPKPFSSAGSGRLELASAIASIENPLTARVMVNRVWHHLFGAGLVRTVDDFGHVGDKASHPELLDHLAHRFTNDGWSVKRLIRDIVLTKTFQASHLPTAAAIEVDPENRLLSHYPVRRMEAEAIRDALLTASGRLDGTLYGPSIAAYRDKDNEYRRLFRGPLDGNGRRSIYIKVTLMEAPKFLEAFNLPGSKVTQGRRDVTHVPAQALAMLNDPFVLQQADVWARRLVMRTDATASQRVEEMFHAALGRSPRPEERERFTRFVADLAQLHQVPAGGVLSDALVWRDVAHTLFNLQEFISIP